MPEALLGQVRVGSLVRVPLRERLARGVIVALHTDSGESTTAKAAPSRRGRAASARTPRSIQYKPIHSLLTPEFYIDADIISLALWIADYYVCAPGEALRAASFIGLRPIASQTETLYRLRHPAEWAEGGATATAERLSGSGRLSPQQRRVLNYLAEYAGQGESVSAGELCDACAVSRAVLNGLVKRGLIEAHRETLVREDGYPSYLPPSSPFDPNPAQSAALDAITAALDARRHRAFLLHGVTGSGKTEVYLQALERTLAQGRQGIILVPEIALTPQTLDRFRSRFGRERVGVFHSQLSVGQKFDLWRRIKAGGIQALVGTRSAVFAPFEALGLLVVDEEHETSYKQDAAPRYHARDVGLMRASRVGATVILGSATPSLESWHNARTGKFTLLHLPRRALDARMPNISVLDMREETAEQANVSFLSRTLQEAIAARLTRGEQTILFLNRRGWAPFIMCMSCRTALRCPQDDLTLSWHKKPGRAICHFCNHMIPLPSVCPQCGEAALMPIGLGTEKVEEEIERLFPAARLVRFDRDTAARREAFLDLWDRVARGEADIILGTQMIAKGFHLERVTLVGVVLADSTLFVPDFRAAERTFALLTQVAGRAGRADRPGEVIIQTYMPFHYAIGDASTGEFEPFAEAELRRRRLMRFPPWARLAALTVSGADYDNVKRFALEWADEARRIEQQMAWSRPAKDRKSARSRSEHMSPSGQAGHASLVGTAPPPIARLRNRWRWRLLLRADSPRALHDYLRAVMQRLTALPGRSKFNVTVDVDPVDLL
ncbi:MAG: primosomal protein N' [Candidatus Sumerlaeia bacterium]